MAKKKKNKTFWIRCQLIKRKEFRGGGTSYLVRDLKVDERVWIPGWLIENSRKIPGDEYLFCISDAYKSKDKLWALTPEERRGYLELAGAL